MKTLFSAAVCIVALMVAATGGAYPMLDSVAIIEAPAADR